MGLETQKIAIIVFGMDGCPACEHYIPRLVTEAETLRGRGYPFVVYQPGITLAPNAIPIVLYDAASADADVQQLADRFAVEATPTTILAARGPGSFKVEGNLANNQIVWLLMMALEANQ
jgi:thioredoxin-related protein